MIDSLKNDTHPEERRKSPSSALVLMVQQIHEDVNALDGKLTVALSEHKKEMREMLENAFPGGDADGHRRHHEAAIMAAEKRANFWSTMHMELAKWGLVGFAAWAVVHLWQARHVILEGITK